MLSLCFALFTQPESPPKPLEWLLTDPRVTCRLLDRSQRKYRGAGGDVISQTDICPESSIPEGSIALLLVPCYWAPAEYLGVT